MIELNDDYEDLEDFFEMYGISTASPGFYDDLNFTRLEQMIPNFLEYYAAFVLKKSFSPDYLQESEEKIFKISKILHKELIRDGRQGACIDLSLVLSRILDLENVWNYITKGSVTIEFPPDSNISKKYFWSVYYGQFKAGHVWVVAPPFKIVDLTIHQQPYKMNEEKYIPDIILQKEASISDMQLSDIISPEVMQQLNIKAGRDHLKILNSINPRLIPFYDFFEVDNFISGETKFKYTPFGITASDQPLKNITSLKLNGIYGLEIYNDLIKGKL
ncbi:hypothetical protein [Chryseobacterium geocarposphaerae]|uniref:Uncharacterized protein n=1 Tax=Chryseobacterium geocarposphaerae TaxID=1416776 RepID=A0A2M9C920_9FLAO|nr:hypothetical protein [Chryseobacterium geocarposphaerae]PJJ67340.1 hypothetical protein CLV73_1347 [Chryseobacterium geocarposphaerae]